MKNKTNYSPNGKEDKIKRLVQRIAEEVNHIQFIKWDDFFLKYLKLDTVLPPSKLDNVRWVNERPKWVASINRIANQEGIPIYLSVQYDEGINIYENGEAASKFLSKRTRKFSNQITRTTTLCEEMKNSFPELEKAFDSFKNNILDAAYSFYGRIDTSKINKGLKQELKQIMQSNFPEEEE